MGNYQGIDLNNTLNKYESRSKSKIDIYLNKFYELFL